MKKMFFVNCEIIWFTEFSILLCWQNGNVPHKQVVLGWHENFFIIEAIFDIALLYFWVRV